MTQKLMACVETAYAAAKPLSLNPYEANNFISIILADNNIGRFPL